MATGRIVTIVADRGYGFIKDTPGPNGTNNIFFHRSAVTDVQFEDLAEGQTVSFDAGRDPRDASRFRASNVRPFGGTTDVAATESGEAATEVGTESDIEEA
jgi:cold shock CspA family protein